MNIEKLAYDHGANIYENGEVRFYTLNAFTKFAEAYHQAKCNEELQTLRAKVASAEVLVEALKNAEKFINGSVRIESSSFDEPPSPVSERDYQADMLAVELRDTLATYDKLSEDKHDRQ